MFDFNCLRFGGFVERRAFEKRRQDSIRKIGNWLVKGDQVWYDVIRYSVDYQEGCLRGLPNTEENLIIVWAAELIKNNELVQRIAMDSSGTFCVTGNKGDVRLDGYHAAQSTLKFVEEIQDQEAEGVLKPI